MIEPAAGGALDRVSVVENADALPRAYFVSSAEPAADRHAALERVLALGPRLRDTVVLEGEPSPRAKAGSAGSDETRGRLLAARIVRHEARLVEIDVDAPGPGWLVLTDAHDPGWRATVDGIGAPVRRANATFRAVGIGSGPHRVRFSYDPASVRLGLVAGAVAVGYALARWLRAR